MIVPSSDRSRRELDAPVFLAWAANRSLLHHILHSLPRRSADALLRLRAGMPVCPVTPATIALSLVLSVVAVVTARADAWTQPRGRTYLETSISAYAADSYYDDGGNALEGDWWDPQSTYNETTLSQILEYGWREDVTFLFDARFRSLLVDRGTSVLGDDQVSGLGDIGLGLRKKLPTKSLAAAIQGRVELPGGYDPERQEYSLGAGEVNLEGRFQLAGTLGGDRRGWWNGEAGYRLRGGDFGDEIVFLLEAGTGIAGPLSAQLGFDVLSALETTFIDIEDPAQRDPLQYASRATVGGALRWTFSPAAAVAAGYARDVAGQNSFQSHRLKLTVELRP